MLPVPSMTRVGGENGWRIAASRRSNARSRSTSCRRDLLPRGRGGAARRRLTNAPRQVQLLEEKLVETREALARATGQNEKLADALRDEKQRIEALAEEVEKLSQPPATFGVFIGSNDDGSVDVVTAGRKLRVMPAPDLDADKLVSGAQVILNDALNVVEVLDPDGTGQVVKVKDKLGTDRAVVVSRGDEEHVAYLAGSLLGTVVRAGDPVLYDARSGVATELLPREEVEELVLEEIPTSPTRTSEGSRDRSRPSATPSSFPSSTRSSSRNISSRRRKACCSTDRRGAGRRDRQGRRQVAGGQGARADRPGGRPQLLPEREGSGAPQQVRRRDRAADPGDLPTCKGAERGGAPRDRVLRRDGFDLPHARDRHQLGRGVDDRATAALRAGRCRDPQERDRRSARPTARTSSTPRSCGRDAST